MFKKFGRSLTALLAATMLLIPGQAVFAAGATEEEYQAINADQKDYYNNTYRPVYASYRQAIKDLRAKIRDTRFETKEQIDRFAADLRDLVTEHRAFYGDRTTVGKSRYEVPKYRVAMYKAADEDKDYDSAIELCKQLKIEVRKRVDYMNGVMDKIADLKDALDNLNGSSGSDPTPSKPDDDKPSVPSSGDADVKVTCTQNWGNSFHFQIQITNTTSEPISNDWNLAFDMENASVYTVWRDSNSALTFSQNNGRLTIAPQDQWQTGLVIPANGTIVIEGQANGDANSVKVGNAVFNNKGISVSYAA